jgi:hypothetical protein
MIAVASAVVLLALLITVAILTGGNDSITIDMFGSDVVTSGSALYVTGLVTGIIVLFTLRLLRIGLKKSWRLRKRRKELERQAQGVDGHDDDSQPPVDTTATSTETSPD